MRAITVPHLSKKNSTAKDVVEDTSVAELPALLAFPRHAFLEN